MRKIQCAICRRSECTGSDEMVMEKGQVYHYSCLRSHTDMESLKKKYPDISEDILRRARREDQISLLSKEWCVVYETDDNEQNIVAFDSKEQMLGHMKEAEQETENYWSVGAVLHNQKPVEFSIKHTVEVLIDEK